MQKRFISLWFRHLTTDWLTLRRPELKDLPFVFAAPIHNRIIITAANSLAQEQGIFNGMAAADAKAIVPDLKIIDEIPGQSFKLLKALGEWCIRYSPLIAIDMPDGLIMDISGCPHLWGGERNYLKEIVTRLRSKGYDVRGAIADTAGAAWAVARFGKVKPIIEPGAQASALLLLPPVALRLEPLILERLQKLGFYKIKDFMNIGRSVLRRRFGEGFLLRLNQALGNEDEPLQLLQPVEAYSERLPCLEAIRTAIGIEIAIKTLLEQLCKRLHGEGKGIRTAILKGYRVDGHVIQATIGTNSPSNNVNHLFKLFELKISSLEPALGIELFTLDAPKVEDVEPGQEILWSPEDCSLEDTGLAQLLDRLANKIGAANIHRYLPQEHHWPERSFKPAISLKEKPTTAWRTDRPRPSLLLNRPEPVEVTFLVPDYPPALFIYQNKIHHVKKADGPERIEREWWLEEGEHRDYYQVEDEKGQRYWLFRLGHYEGGRPKQWFIHGFFA
ncbi:DNA polymerase Y family protein [Mucilaginibacter sp. BJC16-A38]|uniref:Y-family DNA polymerase n=1 Tax=Mucilaginibacter phenanthrenivorans TaxID=1234842 RepID=UPI0021571966|nr:DNA polymerase Y family protein [Mucilaginibacter phenanthrenivorans]MCR8556579.1 DNA polymerase Y family protein [Mucilaginibacter phenanthrenivorans]